MSDVYAADGLTERHPGGARAGSDLDLGTLVSALGRNKYRIGAVTLLVFALAFIGVNIVKPRYTGEAKVLLENRDNAYTRIDRDARNEPNIDQDAVQSQVQLITSRDVSRNVIRNLDLLGNPEFDPVRQGLGPLKQLMVMLGLARNPTHFSPEDRVLDNYSNQLQVYAVRGSRVLAIEFSSHDPVLAAKGANSVADAYLAALEKAKQDVSRNASAWLTAAIEPLRQKVAEADAKVEAYRASTGLYVGANNTTVPAQQLTELNTQLSNARSQQADLQGRARIIRAAIKNGHIFDVSEIANNEVVRRLIESRATLKAQIAQESRTLLPSHPRMRELNAQLTGLDVQIRAAAERTARNLENDARVAGARVESLTAELDAQKKTVGAANESEVELRALERDAKTLHAQLESFLQKNNEAIARNVSNAVPPDARIISRAIVPDTPTFPKKLPIMFITTLATLLLACAVVVTRELVSGRAFIVHDAPERFVYAAPGVGPVEAIAVPAAEIMPEPRVNSAPEPAAVAAPAPMPARLGLDTDAAYTRAVQGIVAEIRAAKPPGRGAVILVAAPAAGSGASSIAVNLGRTLVRSGRSILAEFDRGWPSLNRLVVEREPRGIADIVSGAAGFGDAIHRDRASRLHVLPLGRNVRAEMFVEHADMLETTLDALTETYDFVVCDMGQAEECPPAMLARADAVLLVARGSETEPATVDAYHWLRENGAAGVSVILTPALPVSEPANDAGGMARPA